MNLTPRSPSPLIVAIEGLCFAGKTTLAAALGHRLGATVLADYADLAPLPVFPPPDCFAVRTALSGFLSVEVARADAARAARSGVVLYDRCPLTLIAHEHAMAAIGVPSDPHTAAVWFTNAAASGAIHTPDAYVYLSVTDETFGARQRERGPLPDHLVAAAVRARITDIYTAYAAATGPRRALAINGDATLSELVEQAARFVTDLPERDAEPPPPWTMLAALPTPMRGSAV